MTRARSLSLLANANAFTVSGSNNVGIGSTLPDGKLDVDGDILVGTAITIGKVSGIITATSFRGDGSQLTGVDSSNLIDSGDTNRVAANTAGIVVTGIATVTGDMNVGGVLTYDDVTNVDSLGIITARSYVSIADSIVHTGDINTSLRFPAADTFTVETGGSEAIRVNSNQRLLVGHTAQRGIGQLEIEGTSFENSGLTLVRNVNSTGGTALNICKTRGDKGSNTSVQDDDVLGGINFRGADGANLRDACDIRGEVDGSPSQGTDMPGRLVFRTSADNSSSPTERLRIDSSGRLLQGKTATKGSTGENVPTYCTETASNNPNVLEIANNGTNANSYSALVLSRSDGTSVNSHTSVDVGDKIGEVCFIGADGSDRFNTAASIHVSAAADFTANDCPADLIFSTNGGSASATQRLSINSAGITSTYGFAGQSFRFNNDLGVGARGVQIWANNINPWKAFVGTNLNFDGTNYVKPSDDSSTNWGNVSGIIFEGTNTGTSASLRFLTDLPGGNGLDHSLGGANSAIDTLTVAYFTGDGDFLPGSDDTYDLGATDKRWANIYSADLQLSNEGSSNDVDGTWGKYTIQEGENDLFLLNRRNGKKYRFMLEEV